MKNTLLKLLFVNSLSAFTVNAQTNYLDTYIGNAVTLTTMIREFISSPSM